GRGLRRRPWLLLAPLVLGLCLTGCDTQSPLSPHSRASSDIATLWWWMLGAAAIVFLGAIGLLVASWFRRDRRGLPLRGRKEGWRGPRRALAAGWRSSAPTSTTRRPAPGRFSTARSSAIRATARRPTSSAR